MVPFIYVVMFVKFTINLKQKQAKPNIKKPY